MTELLTLKAYAKINLTLEVLRQRKDTYHEIESIVQTIDLNDTLTFEHNDRITLECGTENMVSSDNLVIKAAHLLKNMVGYNEGVRILLVKNIPISAGLGGGSSDAATTLRGLNLLWKLGLSVRDLMPIAAQLGSDVPFFLRGGTAMVQGRGERVRSLPKPDLKRFLVVVPKITLPNKTSSMYSRLSSDSYSSGQLTRKLEARIRGGGDIPPQLFFNVFDNLARDILPGLGDYWDMLFSLGIREIHLAGSGPALFTPVASEKQGVALKAMLQSKCGLLIHLVSPWQPLVEG